MSLVQALLVRTEAEFARAHGQVADGGFAIIALGKYGAQELTPESDLDLTFVYDCPPDTKFSHGDRPLMIGEYYSRLSKRVINALSALTSEGRLYDVDMRLRPSGSSGPIAVHIDGFRDYQNSRAWTWEHMALTRARVVAAPTQLKIRIEDTIDSVLGMRRDSEKLLMDVAEMRERIDREHGTDDPWQVKHVRGGLVDLEFICQFFILRYASQHPSIAVQNSASALHALSDAGLIDSELSDELAEATILHRNVQGFLRQTLQTAFNEDSAPQGLREALAGTTGSKNFEALKNALLDTERRVYEHYQKLIGRPALTFDLNAKKGTE